MKFPFVTRKKYDQLIDCSKKLCARVIELEDERDAIIGRACALAATERADREQEHGHFEAILPMSKVDARVAKILGGAR